MLKIDFNIRDGLVVPN